MNIKQLLLATALITSLSSIAIAEEKLGFTPDISLVGVLEHIKNDDGSSSNNIDINNRSFIGGQYIKKISDDINLIGALKMHKIIDEYAHAEEAWIGASTNDYQVEIGVLKHVRHYMGGRQDDPLNRTHLATLRKVIPGGHNSAISYLNKSLLGGEFIVEIGGGDVDSATSFSTDIAYRISNDKKDTIGGKMVGGDEIFVLYRHLSNSDSYRVGGRYTVGNLTTFAMKHTQLTTTPNNKSFISLTYKPSDKLRLVLESAKNSYKHVKALALQYRPVHGVIVTLGNKKDDEYNSSKVALSVEYRFGSMIK